ncbi:MAG: cell division protein FtsZ [Oceanospirillaceae bacterium]|nr:cell division protein FtsZ [Oceanospirillaceae bacterium]
MFELAEDVLQNAVIKVIGVGGGGGNAVQHMVENTVEGVEFICANTDAQALRSLSTDTVLQLGASHTKGLGAGANPDVGRQAARDDEERIAGTLKGADMVFITAGMGGGTGTGAAPVVAEIAKEMGILTVAVVTRPFSFEGKKRQVIAEEGIKTLSETVDSLITIPNEKLLEVLGTNSSLMEAFGKANSVLHGAVKGISDLITRPGMINVDFADVRTVMQQQGQAMMGRGSSKGDNRAMEATLEAIGSPYLENIDLKGATGLLVNVTAGPDLSLGEFSTVGAAIGEYADDEATVVVGTVLDPELKDELHVTVVATGLGSKEAKSSSDDAAEKVQTAKKEEAVKRPAEKASAAPAEKRERPAAVKRPSGGSRPRTKTEGDMDYLDVPAFLRRQAD